MTQVTAPRAPRAAELLHDGAGLLLTVPLWVWWACWRGALPTTVWAPGVIYLAAVVVVLAFARPPERPRGARLGALVALVLLAALAGLSMLWAADPGAAWVGAERAALYALALAIPLLWPPGAAALRAGVTIWPFAVLIGCVVGLAGTLASPGSLVTGRLASPIAYPNATAALCLMGAFPAIVLAARRETLAWLRVALLASAGTLAGIALLTQSRGTVIGTVLTVAAALAFCPGRLRLCVPFGLVALGVLIVSSSLLDVRTTDEAGDPRGAVHQAIAALIALALALALAGATYVLIDRRVEPPRELVARASRLAGRVAIGLALLAAVAFLIAEGNPFAWANARWSDFKTPDYKRLEAGGNRFSGGLGSNRYDYWRASVGIARDHPLAGTGADNFASAYLERRRTLKAPIWAHSVWFTALSELGVPGFLLLAAFLALLALALARAWRPAAPAGRALIVAAALPGFYFVVHSSGDFLQAFPALVVPALALAAAATFSAAPPLVRRRTRVVPAAIALAVALSVLPVFVSEHLAAGAAGQAGSDPAAALDKLDSAVDIDPLNSGASLSQGVVALRAGRTALAERAFAEAARRDDKGWFARLELALLAASRGDRARAVALLDQACRLNPRDPLLATVRPGVQSGRPIDPLDAARRALAEGG